MTEEPETIPHPDFWSEDLTQSVMREMELAGADFRDGAFLNGMRSWGQGASAPEKSFEELLDEDGLDLSNPLGIGSFNLRDQYIQEFGFCVPTPPFVDRLSKLGPLLEVGAGRGYLATLVKNAGGDIIATDPYIHEPKPNLTDVLPLNAQEAIAQFPGRTLISSWPTLGHPWLTEVAQTLPQGQGFIMIGEGPGGCTGSRCLYDLLASAFTPAPELLWGTDVWRFPRIHDTAQAFRRQ